MTSADVTAVTGAIDYSTILTGAGAIGGAVIVAIVAFRGLKMLLGAAKSA